jgi:uncharacterized protein YxeA
MSKKTLIILVAVLVVLAAILAYAKFSYAPEVEVVSVKTTDSSAEVQQEAEGKKPANSTDNSIRFGCDNGKTFTFDMTAVHDVPFAYLFLNNDKEAVLIAQSASSPHLFEQSGNSLYVEGDEASLEYEGEKFENCVAAKI